VRRNFDVTGGRIVAEPAMMGLAPQLDRGAANRM
jgi:hypothetical protein